MWALCWEHGSTTTTVQKVAEYVLVAWTTSALIHVAVALQWQWQQLLAAAVAVATMQPLLLLLYDVMNNGSFDDHDDKTQPGQQKAHDNEMVTAE